jgi:glycosyltransferase involved in cell wall biosynthesis
VQVDASSPSARRRRLRILVVIKVLGYGGAERLLVDTVANGDHRSFDYEVAYVLESEHALVPSVEAHGTPVHDLGARSNLDLRWMARLRRILTRGRFDVVHFHLPYTASLGRLVVASLPSARRPAIVYTEHSLWNKMAVVVKGLNRVSIGLDQSLIVVSDAARDALPTDLRERSEVIVHGIDLARSQDRLAHREEIRARVRSAWGVADGETVAITVANLRSEKGYDVLLDAARAVQDRRLPIRFISVGRGPLDQALRQRSDALGLGEQVRFLGERDDVLDLLVASDVFVLPSHQEGLPVALMEATSVGMPIVATAVGGVPQVITDGVQGLIVPPGRPVELADAVARIASDPDLARRLGQGAKEASSMFDVTTASRQIEEIYRRVAEGGR